MSSGIPTIICTALSFSLVLLAGCEEKKPAAGTPSATGKASAHDDHAHPVDDHGGAAIDLGATVIGPFEVKASRDEGKVVAGKEAAVDVLAAASAGSTARPTAVRFWIGTQDAKGSVKAKAEIEDAAKSNWHAHVEVPNPIPEGSKLWVEIEDDQGGKSEGSFDLRT